MDKSLDRTRAILHAYWQVLDGLRSPAASGVAESQVVYRAFAATWQDFRLSSLGLGPVAAPALIEFILDFMEATGIGRLFDPDVGNGLLFLALSESRELETAVGHTRMPNIAHVLSTIAARAPALKVGDPESLLAKADTLYDMIVCAPPMGMRTEEKSISTEEETPPLRAPYGDRLLLASLRCLAANGHALYIVGPRFLWAADSARAHLAEVNCHLTAYLELAADLTTPRTGVPLALAMITRQPCADLFVGAVSASADRNQLLLKNLLARRADDDARLGIIVDPTIFLGLESYLRQQRITRLARTLDLEATLVGDVATINFTKASEPPGFEARPNTVYLPLLGTSPAVTDVSQLRLKPHNYAQLILDARRAEAAYVAAFFNSELGQLVRTSTQSGTVIPRLTKHAMQRVPLYLPPLDTQLAALQVDASVMNLRTEAERLHEQLWSNPCQPQAVTAALRRTLRDEQPEDWVEGLPFPLASILWSYYACGPDPHKRTALLLHFFEAYAEFWATILLSAFSEDATLWTEEGPALQDALSKAHATLTMSSFGTWVRIVERLAKRTRTLLNGPAETRQHCFSLFRTSGRTYLDYLCDGPLVGLIQEANGRRNTWHGHGGLVSDHEAQQRQIVLENLLAQLRSRMGSAWDNMQLLTPGKNRFVNGTFRYEAQRLIGSRTPFKTVLVEVTTPFEDGALHLLGTTDAEALKLLPLVRIQPAPRTALNACYFYNRIDPSGARFVSYHFEQEAEFTDPSPATATLLHQLFRSGG